MGFGNSSRWRALEFGQLDGGVHVLGNISEPTRHGLKSQSGDPKWSFGCGWRSHIFSHSDFSRSKKTWLRRKRKSKGWDRNRWHILSQRHAVSQVCEAYSQVPRSHKSRFPKLRKWIFADEFLQLEFHLYGFIIIWHCLLRVNTF